MCIYILCVIYSACVSIYSIHRTYTIYTVCIYTLYIYSVCVCYGGTQPVPMYMLFWGNMLYQNKIEI